MQTVLDSQLHVTQFISIIPYLKFHKHLFDFFKYT